LGLVDTSYRPWEGARRGRLARIGAIVRVGVGLAFEGNLTRIVLVCSYSTVALFLGLLYIVASLMRLAAGLIRPTGGEVRVLGERPWDNPRLNLRLGICPEHDGFHEGLGGRAYLRWVLPLRGRTGPEARRAAETALERVRLADAGDRRIGTYSRGMRQRLKLAQAIAHDPEMLILDEPLTGTDPLVRQELIRLIRGLAAEGRHVLVSSHVLHEIEALTREIVLLHRGRLVAFGDRREIRALIDRHPHSVAIRTPRPRDLGAALAARYALAAALAVAAYLPPVVACGYAFRRGIAASVAVAVVFEVIPVRMPIRLAAWSLTNNVCAVIADLAFHGEARDHLAYNSNWVFPAAADAASYVATVAAVALALAMLAARRRGLARGEVG
jgi:ABC-type Na+ transport system ATPase subunit NatA